MVEYLLIFILKKKFFSHDFHIFYMYMSHGYKKDDTGLSLESKEC